MVKTLGELKQHTKPSNEAHCQWTIRISWLVVTNDDTFRLDGVCLLGFRALLELALAVVQQVLAEVGERKHCLASYVTQKTTSDA